MALKINTNIKNDVDEYLLDARAVKGGYVVVSGINNDTKENLPAATLVIGTLVYDAKEETSYRWDGTAWIEETSGGDSNCGLSIVDGLICCTFEEETTEEGGTN